MLGKDIKKKKKVGEKKIKYFYKRKSQWSMQLL